MSVSETIVREFFELQGFLVHQRRKYVSPTARDDDEIDFFVANPRPAPARAVLPFELSPADLVHLDRAMVVVKGWHTETFSPARLASTPEIFRFVEPASFRQATRFFGDPAELTKILIVPALPQAEDLRAQSIELLRFRGVDAVIPFRALLADLIRRTEINRNYQKSDLLQIIRILKNYDFFRESQMELFKPTKRRAARKKAADPRGKS